jgi:hypothetical protein
VRSSIDSLRARRRLRARSIPADSVSGFTNSTELVWRMFRLDVSLGEGLLEAISYQ